MKRGKIKRSLRNETLVSLPIKKEMSLIILISILSIIPSLLAVEITLSESSYQPRQTLQAEITGNFISLNSDNILLYKEGTPRSMPAISGLTKFKNTYYAYMILPNQEGNFSIQIKGSKYQESGALKTETITKDFVIKRTNQSALQINPGFIILDEDEKEFSIKVKSLFDNQEVSVSFSNESQLVSLIEDNEKTIKFPFSKSEQEKIDLKIGEYNVPVFILKKQNNSDINPVHLILQTDLKFNPQQIVGKIISGQDYFFRVSLKNIGNQSLIVTLSNDLNAEIKPETLELSPGNETYLDITIPVPETKEDIEGTIVANFNDLIMNLPVLFEIVENKTEVNLDDTSITGNSDCLSGLKGDLCLDIEECDGETTESLQGSCCLGECKQKKQRSYRWIFGVLLLIVVLGIIGFLYWKSKNKSKPKPAKEILKEKSDKFQQRMKGEEISGGIGRI